MSQRLFIRHLMAIVLTGVSLLSEASAAKTCLDIFRAQQPTLGRQVVESAVKDFSDRWPVLKKVQIDDISENNLGFAFVNEGCEFGAICANLDTFGIHFPIHERWQASLGPLNPAYAKTIIYHELGHLIFDDYLRSFFKGSVVRDIYWDQKVPLFYQQVDRLRDQMYSSSEGHENDSERKSLIREKIQRIEKNKDRLRAILKGYDELIADVFATLENSEDINTMANALVEVMQIPSTSPNIVLRRFHSSEPLVLDGFEENVLWNEHNIFAQARRDLRTILPLAETSPSIRKQIEQAVMKAAAFETQARLDEPVNDAPYSIEELNEAFMTRLNQVLRLPPKR